MYLSRLILNPRSRRVRNEIADTYQMHRSLMRAFADGLNEDEERVLFRLESQERGAVLVLLVQSLTLPDWSWLGEPAAHGYLLPVDEPNPAIKTFDVRVAPGQVLTFRLRANPTVRRDGKRWGLYRWDEQRRWLERKAEQGGFQVLSVVPSRQAMITGQIERGGSTHRLRLLSVQFDGVLRVREPDHLRERVCCGIGSGKAFGLGLLSLAPARYV